MTPSQPTGATTPSATSTAAPTTTEVAVTATPTSWRRLLQPTPAPQAAAQTTEAPARLLAPPRLPRLLTATSAPSSGGAVPRGGQDGYMSVVTKWRSAGGLRWPLTEDSTLEGNAMKTSTDSTNGSEHELNPGTFAQVLAPGDRHQLRERLCRRLALREPHLPGLNGICSTRRRAGTIPTARPATPTSSQAPSTARLVAPSPAPAYGLAVCCPLPSLLYHLLTALIDLA